MTAREIVKANYRKTNSELRNLIRQAKGYLTNKQISDIKYQEKLKEFKKPNKFILDKIKLGNTKSEDISFSEEIDINHKNVDLRSNSNPKTLEQLLSVCNVDTSIWKVERYVANKWEVASKTEKGEIVNTPLFQIKAFLERIVHIESEIPPLKCISFKAKEVNCCKPIVKKSSKLKRALIVPDSHNGYSRKDNELIEFHDRLAWNLVLQISKKVQPERIIFLGDMLDFAELSDKFIKSPDFYWTIQPAIVELSWYLFKLRKLNPNAEMDYLGGNHEERLKKSIINHLIAVYQLKKANNANIPVLSVENLLCLNDYNIKYHSDYPNSEIWLNNHLCCSHGSVVRSESGDTAKSILRNARCSEIIGHIHRMEMACATKFSRKGPSQYKVFSPGTIARIDGVVPANKAHNNWQQGLCIVEYSEENDELFEIIPITINNGKCIFNSELYTGQSDFNEMLNSIDQDFAKLFE